MKPLLLLRQSLCLAATFASIITLPLAGQAQPSPLSFGFVAPTNGQTFIYPTNVLFDVSAPASVDVVGLTAQVAPIPGQPTPLFVIRLATITNWISLDPPRRDFLYTWTNAPSGTWLVTAGTLSSSNNSVAAYATVQYTVIRTNPPPPLSIQIASPTNGATYAGPTNIQIIAGVQSSNDTPVNVTFYDGSNLLGVVSNFAVVDPPGSPGLPPGSLAAFLVWSNQAPGLHTLTAQVVDSNGLSSVSSPVDVTILSGVHSNLPPTVRITSPPDYSLFRAPVNIALLAYATAPGDSISGVQFFAGSNSLGFGQPILSPVIGPVTPYQAEVVPDNGPQIIVRFTNLFELIWSNAPPGTYALTAVATDSGGSATSPPVNITIVAPPPPPTNLPVVVTIVASDPIAIAGTNCQPWLGGPLTWSNWVSPAAIWRWNTNCGPQDATFTVHRSGNTSNSLVINYTIGGTASNGVDYVTLPGSITIPAGQTESTITVVPIDNGSSNLSSTVILTLMPPPLVIEGYIIGFPHSAEAIIIDSSAPHPVPASLLPDRSFDMCLAGPDGAWFRIDYTTNLTTWTPICTNQVVNGLIEFIDPTATDTTRVYRTVPLVNPPSD